MNVLEQDLQEITDKMKNIWISIKYLIVIITHNFHHNTHMLHLKMIVLIRGMQWN